MSSITGAEIYYNKDDKDLRVFMKNGDKLTKIGDLGGTINLDTILANVLLDHRSQMVNDKFSGASWLNNVLPSFDWDLKSNKKTVFGVVWDYDQAQKSKANTGFTFNYNNHTLDLQFKSAADVGNFHAGYTGVYAGVPVSLQKMFAGAGEKVKNVIDLDGKDFWGNPLLSPPFGDRKPDYFWNMMGMSAAIYDKQINAIIKPPPMPIKFELPKSDGTYVKPYAVH